MKDEGLIINEMLLRHRTDSLIRNMKFAASSHAGICSLILFKKLALINSQGLSQLIDGVILTNIYDHEQVALSILDTVQTEMFPFYIITKLS